MAGEQRSDNPSEDQSDARSDTGFPHCRGRGRGCDTAFIVGSAELLDKGEHRNHGIRKAGDPVEVVVLVEVGPDEPGCVAE